MAKNGTIGDADPLVIMVPVTESAAPLPCDTPGAMSCADLDAFGRCEGRNETCNLRGDCVNDQCFCDLPYLGFNCSEAVGCNYWAPNPSPGPSPGPSPSPTPTLAQILTRTQAQTLTRCNYWDDESSVWSSEGCASKGAIEVNCCASNPNPAPTPYPYP